MDDGCTHKKKLPKLNVKNKNPKYGQKEPVREKHIFQGKRSNTVPPGPGPGLGCDESWLRGGEGGVRG